MSLELMGFAATVILISSSGVMSPGPLFAANLLHGIRGGWKAGLRVAYGHTVVELPLIFLIGVGAISLEIFPYFKLTVGILGALGLFAFAAIQIRNTVKQNSLYKQEPKYGAFVTGVFLSALNPFFLIWWFTIGFKLISDAIVLWSMMGIFVLFAFHIWMDVVWLGAMAALANKGAKFISNKNFKAAIIGLSGLLILFGVKFLVDVFP